MVTNYAVLLAEGFEEIEAVTIIDVLRRADLPVTVLSVQPDLCVTGGHGIKVFADEFLGKVLTTEYSGVILPGGATGVDNLRKSELAKEFIFAHKESFIAAICAAPSLLAEWGLLQGVRATCYPSFRAALEAGNCRYMESEVVEDRNIITSRGPATAMAFALAIVNKMQNEQIARQTSEKMLV
ncbi:MAG: DJ-1/PfpI family protein [Leptospiraceae bacterium]|nr:DJ-1/PfpI family protein [Leptospiraceae bacterium]MCB1200493.1 DJ-1/PfpI family protein [Leptospiraceae bacterium]